MTGCGLLALQCDAVQVQWRCSIAAVHDESVDVVENWCAAHAVHALAPAAQPVSVIEPAAHSEQYDLPASAWYFPASHAVQDVSVGCIEYLPAAH